MIHAMSIVIGLSLFWAVTSLTAMASCALVSFLGMWLILSEGVDLDDGGTFKLTVGVLTIAIPFLMSALNLFSFAEIICPGVWKGILGGVLWFLLCWYLGREASKEAPVPTPTPANPLRETFGPARTDGAPIPPPTEGHFLRGQSVQDIVSQVQSTLASAMNDIMSPSGTEGRFFDETHPPAQAAEPQEGSLSSSENHGDGTRWDEI